MLGGTKHQWHERARAGGRGFVGIVRGGGGNEESLKARGEGGQPYPRPTQRQSQTLLYGHLENEVDGKAMLRPPESAVHPVVAEVIILAATGLLYSFLYR